MSYRIIHRGALLTLHYLGVLVVLIQSLIIIVIIIVIYYLPHVKEKNSLSHYYKAWRTYKTCLASYIYVRPVDQRCIAIPGSKAKTHTVQSTRYQTTGGLVITCQAGLPNPYVQIDSARTGRW